MIACLSHPRFRLLQFDPAATYTIASSKLVQLFMELKPPLGFGGRATRAQAHTYVVSLELPDYDGFVPFKDVCTHTAIALHAEKVSQTGGTAADLQAKAARENMFACEVEGKCMLDADTKKRLAELGGRAHLGGRGARKPTSTWAEYAAAVKFQQAFRRQKARRKAREMLRDQGHFVEGWEKKRNGGSGDAARSTRRTSLAAGNAVSALFSTIHREVPADNDVDQHVATVIATSHPHPIRTATGPRFARGRMHRNPSLASSDPRTGLSISTNGRVGLSLGARGRASPLKAAKRAVHHTERKAVEQAVRCAEAQASAAGVGDMERRRMIELARAKAVRKARRRREEERLQRIGTSASAAQLSRLSVSQSSLCSHISPLKQRRLARHDELQRRHGEFMRQQQRLLATAPAQEVKPAAATPDAANLRADTTITAMAMVTAPAAATGGDWGHTRGASSPLRKSAGRGRGRGRGHGRGTGRGTGHGRASSAPPQPAPVKEDASQDDDRKLVLLRAQSEADRARAALLEAETKQLQLRAQLAALRRKDVTV